LAIVNRRLGIAVYSPKVNAKGNSVRRILACKALANELGLHAFEFTNVGSIVRFAKRLFACSFMIEPPGEEQDRTDWHDAFLRLCPINANRRSGFRELIKSSSLRGRKKKRKKSRPQFGSALVRFASTADFPSSAPKMRNALTFWGDGVRADTDQSPGAAAAGP